MDAIAKDNLNFNILLKVFGILLHFYHKMKYDDLRVAVDIMQVMLRVFHSFYSHIIFKS